MRLALAVPSGSVLLWLSLTLSAGIAVAAPAPPTFTSFWPTSGPVGTPIILTGTSFTGATVVTFNGQSASFAVESGSSIATTVPAGATTGPISVATPGGTTTSQQYFSLDTSCIQAIEPRSAEYPASGGSGRLDVAAEAGCSWSTGWVGEGLTVRSGWGGIGNGTVWYSMAANTGAERNGSVWVGGRPFTVRQSGWLNDIGAELIGVRGSSAAWGDYDKDGDLDILITGYKDGIGGITRLYRNDGGGAFTSVTTTLTGAYYGSAAWGDYDADGDLDILITGYNTDAGGGVAKVYRNDAGTFTDIGAALTGTSSGSGAWGDCDGDGDLDVLLTGWDGLASIARVYRNDGGGVFTDVAAGLTGVHAGRAAWGDYDADGDLDILLAGRSSAGPVAKVYRSDGGNVFTEVAAGLTGVEFSAVAWGDYDKDGDLDVLLAGRTAGDSDVSKVYRNDGGVFTDIQAGLAPVEDGAVVWADYDNDGDLDILLNGLAPSTGFASLYRNDGGGVFTDMKLHLAGTQGSIACGDYDSDGDLDILITGAQGSFDVSKVYRAGTSPGAFFTLNPCRLVDTRSAPSRLGGPALAAGAERVFAVFGQCGIPATARAVSVNLTVTQATTAGHLRAYPASGTRPVASSINYGAMQTRANNAVVALGATGELAFFCAQPVGSADLVLDVYGYFE